MEDTTEIITSITTSIPHLETTLQSLKTQTQTLTTTYDAYKQGYGKIRLVPNPPTHAFYEALQLSTNAPLTLNEFLQHLHQYLYQYNLYNPQTQQITLNSLLQTTFSIPSSQANVHYFSLFRQIPQLFTQIPIVPPVVESTPSMASLESVEK
jgi:hypothetical protein